MSITSALNNALSGLTAASRSAQVVSSNVSNALTEGYVKREIQLGGRMIGGLGAGVSVLGVTRIVDDILVRDRRLADSDRAGSSVASDFARQVIDLVGEPDDAGSLSGLYAQFDAALVDAASRPDSDARLAAVQTAATDLANGFNRISNGVQTLRESADLEISTEVARLNNAMEEVAQLNGDILRARANDIATVALEDQRQLVIDGIADLIPVRQFPRDNGTVALYSVTGALLVDTEPATFEFTNTGIITPDMTLASGALSGLQINGTGVSVSGDNSPIAGGRLAALFRLRDTDAVAVQTDLDVVAQDLVTRFEDTTLDPTLTAGDPGLFTDAGGALNLADTVGLSGRLRVNDLVVPSEGGDLWRLRDGLGAAAPGSLGDATLLSGYSDALARTQVPSTGGRFSGGEKTASALAADMLSIFGQSVTSAEARASFSEARYNTLRDAELADGVDTDQELQRLLLIEQAYAANARVVQTVDQLIELLTRI